jgi:membrane protease YdiL (CAAX protease family)
MALRNAPTSSHTPPVDYFQRSKLPLPTLLVLLPIILFVEFGFGLAPDSAATRVLATVQLRELLQAFTISPAVVVHGLGVIVVLVLGTWHMLNGDTWRVRLLDLPCMVFEGCIAAVPLLVAAAALLSQHAIGLGSSSGESGLLESVLIAATAALSEEFIFRMCGIALLHLVLVDVLGLKHAVGVTIAVVVTAVAFTFYHNPSTLSPTAITFYAVSGLYLGGLFAMRGLAPAVLAHAAYNIVALN